MARYIDRLGDRYTRLLVVAEGRTDDLNKKYWVCQCDCGAEIEVRSDSLTSGKTQSCGCLQKDLLSARRTKHGYTEEDGFKNYRKDYYLKKKYGISLEQYDAMMEGQNYQCAICGDELEDYSYKTHLDHCHETGRIRGILCRGCNTGIGMLRDNVDILKSAIKYLEN